ncbi:hypothetical protein DY262_12310 [Hydrogenophaga borbori]|uniref:Uncharacterized protein n=1 Tax=Hydrogenophaga borbori TaxID=2294117 RepID=A0A372EI74_9BURK|nr:hypothetical protein [Hydrogenophaga borbori]RFP78098.1 hypothetical protein DY262_12310 [Hydrogenophaga borbori]
MVAKVLKPLVKLFASPKTGPFNQQSQWRDAILKAPVGKVVYASKVKGSGIALRTASNPPPVKAVRPSARVVLQKLADTAYQKHADKGSNQAIWTGLLRDHLRNLEQRDIHSGKMPRDHLVVTEELKEAVKNAF